MIASASTPATSWHHKTNAGGLSHVEFLLKILKPRLFEVKEAPHTSSSARTPQIITCAGRISLQPSFLEVSSHCWRHGCCCWQHGHHWLLTVSLLSLVRSPSLTWSGVVGIVLWQWVSRLMFFRLLPWVLALSSVLRHCQHPTALSLLLPCCEHPLFCWCTLWGKRRGRVKAEGHISSNDQLKRVKKSCPEWSLRHMEIHSPLQQVPGGFSLIVCNVRD